MTGIAMEYYHPELLWNGILHQAHDVLGHNGNVGIYEHVKHMHYWKGLKTNFGNQNEYVKCWHQNLYTQCKNSFIQNVHQQLCIV